MTDKKLRDKAINFKGSLYVMVKDRIQYLAENFEGRYSITTQHQYYPESKMWVVRAELNIQYDTGVCTYTGLAQEIEGSSFINKTSALENAESSAIGRACAMCGIGVIDSIASMDEISKAINRSEKKSSSWFQQAISNTKFMQECLDEDEFIKKIKAKYEIDSMQEMQLREAYKEANKVEANDDLFHD